jgi:hypothetical protein
MYFLRRASYSASERAERNRPPFGHPGKVMLIDLFRMPAPRAPVVPKLADQLLFLCINTYNGPTGRNKTLLLGSDVLELSAPFRAPDPTLLPLVRL